jgi:Fe-S-cluster containining protein
LFTKSSQLQALYSRLPSIDCKRLCQESCGPIPLFNAEARVLLPITPAASVIRGEFPILIDSVTESCPHLSSAGDCRVREMRPMICRLWGLVKAMRCPFGCEPEQWVTPEEAQELMRHAKAL